MLYVILLFAMQRPITNTWKVTIQQKNSSYLVYLDKNNPYGSAMSKLPVNRSKWIKGDNFTEDFIYDENSEIGYPLQVNLKFSKQLG